ncbi:glycosyltransferase [Cutibacterium sp. WCA-380-WT-3A]|uniref:Glycosyltransferase n=1 Tax=Cutibacterium porci TaxID=2605781 RepID=A0A7K0J4I2_9ACTN|nr:glycosyltransferase [Cutibacterium porci]MSS44850.1 glycosyltransferase [Cutibacterium porci]
MRLLIVTPRFHGYGTAIGDAFTRRGYDVVVYAYDAAPRIEKAWNKIRYELPAKIRGTQEHLSGETVTARAIDCIRAVHPELVLTVRGDVLGAAYWEEMRRVTTHSVSWLYDELRRMTFDIDMAAAVSTIITYSREDTAELQGNGIDAHYVPTGFNMSAKPSGRWPRNDVTFVGSNLPARQQLLVALDSAGIPVMAYGREWSDHPIDRLRTWRLKPIGIPARRDVSLSEAYGIMRDSAATINVHGDQDGFTMRTFEACGVGGIQIVDRDDVTEFYDPGKEVLVQHSAEETIELARQVLSDPHRAISMRRAAKARTMAEHTLDHRAAVIDELWS